VSPAEGRRSALGRLATALLAVAALSLVAVPEAKPRTEAPDRTLAAQVAAANAAYAQGRYAEAADLFGQAVARHGYSASLLYDLGNASLRAGRVGEAVLAYERALALAPRDPDIRANLRAARRAARLPAEEGDAWTRLARAASADEWAWGASAMLFLAAGLAIAAALRRAAPTASRRLWALAAAAAIAAVLAALLCARQLAALDRAIVTAEDARLRDAPYGAAELGTSLRPGETVGIEQRHGSYALVRTRAGRSGWIALAAIERIAPRAGEPGSHPSAPATAGGRAGDAGARPSPRPRAQ